MKSTVRYLGMIFFGLSLLAGCATFDAQKIRPTPILHAQEEVPEEQLLDVGLPVFESVELTAKKAQKEGTLPGIRQAESHYIPTHLKNTLQRSGQWGAVRVTPAAAHGADVRVKGKILE
ncbi:MAG: hypothetical protein JSW39_15885, partial [Desulfobacterales bacterium]